MIELLSYNGESARNTADLVRSDERDDLLVRVVRLLASGKVDAVADIRKDNNGEIRVCDTGEQRPGGVDLRLALAEGRDSTIRGACCQQPFSSASLHSVALWCHGGQTP